MQGETNLFFEFINNINEIERDDTICEFKEKEGATVVLEQSKMNELGLSYSFVASWIILTIYSSLDAVGLTTLLSTELAKHNISCNVIAKYYYNHLFITQKMI